jgi:hypothetical protein
VEGRARAAWRRRVRVGVEGKGCWGERREARGESDVGKRKRGNAGCSCSCSVAVEGAGDDGEGVCSLCRSVCVWLRLRLTVLGARCSVDVLEDGGDSTEGEDGEDG